MKTSWMEQYKLLFSAFNDEGSRFWSRFNILMGIQMGGFIGVLASVKTLVANPGLFRMSLMLMTLYSISTAVITARGHVMHEALLRALAMMEADSDGELQLLGLARKSSRVPVGLNQIVGICIASVFVLDHGRSYQLPVRPTKMNESVDVGSPTSRMHATAYSRACIRGDKRNNLLDKMEE